MMKRVLLILLICLIPLANATAGNKKAKKKADADTAGWNYEIDLVATGKQGSVIVKVWSVSKKPEVAAEQSKKNAVHGVVFKGLAPVDRTPGKSPIVRDRAGYHQNADFFSGFFADGGDYMRFVTLTNNGALDAGDVLKVSKKEYKVGVTVTVNYDELRRYMEKNGIVRKLSDGF